MGDVNATVVVPDDWKRPTTSKSERPLPPTNGRFFAGVPPAKAEANYYAATENLDMVGSVKSNRLRATRDASELPDAVLVRCLST